MAKTDPLTTQQSWLFNAIDLGRLGDEYTGLGVKVGIYDDGVQKTHADLRDNYDASLEVVINGVAASPGVGKHGTAVAGIIAATEDNGIGGSGIASGVDFAGVNVFSGAASGSGMLSAIGQMDKFHVTNSSWNWTATYSDPLTGSFGRQFNAALEDGYDNGRGGLGTAIVNSAGNDWLKDTRDANTSMFDSTRYTITVGAVADTGFVSSYSNRGANILVSAPSSGGSKGVTTTDIEGAGGYSSGDSYSYFGGTSAAAPVVTAVIALMLEANPNLGIRDIKEILALSAEHTGSALNGAKSGTEAFGWSTNGADDFNGGGLHFSNDYGYGQVNAYAAVRLAEAWSEFGAAHTAANEVTASANGPLNRAITDNGVTTFNVNMTKNIDIEHVDLTLTLTHPNVKELRVELVSPDGTKSIVLTPGTGTAQSASNWTWTFGSEQFLGELSAGTWQVRITDTKGGNAGTISSYKLEAFGSNVDAHDVFTYTEEYAKMLALDSSRGTLRDTDGGTDWINAAAIAANSTIDLNAGKTSSLGSAKLTIAAGTLIENAIAGDGNDTLIGNAARNELIGGRGNDTFKGDLRGDTIDGGVGVDTADFSARGSYVLVDLAKGTASDSTKLSGIEKVVGTNYNDFLTGAAGDDHLVGGLGNDTIEGGNGADVIDGGSGLDTAVYKSSTAGVTIDLLAGTGRGGHAEGDTLIGIENVQGSNHADTFLGTASANIVWGNGGNDVFDLMGGGDVVYGGSGDDLVYSRGTGTGCNVLRAEAGFDTISYEKSTSHGLNIVLGGSSAASGQRFIDVLIGFEKVIGSNQNDTIRGDSFGNVIDGGRGNDTLYGGLGGDTFQFSGVDFGSDRISDYQDGVDKISFVDNDLTFADLRMTDLGSTCVIDADGLGTITLNNVRSHMLNESDFLFA